MPYTNYVRHRKGDAPRTERHRKPGRPDESLGEPGYGKGRLGGRHAKPLPMAPDRTDNASAAEKIRRDRHLARTLIWASVIAGAGIGLAIADSSVDANESDPRIVPVSAESSELTGKLAEVEQAGTKAGALTVGLVGGAVIGGIVAGAGVRELMRARTDNFVPTPRPEIPGTVRDREELNAYYSATPDYYKYQRPEIMADEDGRLPDGSRLLFGLRFAEAA